MPKWKETLIVVRCIIKSQCVNVFADKWRCGILCYTCSLDGFATISSFQGSFRSCLLNGFLQISAIFRWYQRYEATISVKDGFIRTESLDYDAWNCCWTVDKQRNCTNHNSPKKNLVMAKFVQCECWSICQTIRKRRE